jgi:hypothetical protein
VCLVSVSARTMSQQHTKLSVQTIFGLYLSLLTYTFEACLAIGSVGLVWFGLVGISFNASLGPQRRARKRGRLAEAALAQHALWDKAEYPRIPDPILGPHVRLSAG